jgi:hypothetical protein
LQAVGALFSPGATFAELCESVSLAAGIGAVVDVLVDPTEIPAAPYVNLDQVWKFGIGKACELIKQ